MYISLVFRSYAVGYAACVRSLPLPVLHYCKSWLYTKFKKNLLCRSNVAYINSPIIHSWQWEQNVLNSRFQQTHADDSRVLLLKTYLHCEIVCQCLIHFHMTGLLCFFTVTRVQIVWIVSFFLHMPRSNMNRTKNVTCVQAHYSVLNECMFETWQIPRKQGSHARFRLEVFLSNTSSIFECLKHLWVIHFTCSDALRAKKCCCSFLFQPITVAIVSRLFYSAKITSCNDGN